MTRRTGVAVVVALAVIAGIWSMPSSEAKSSIVIRVGGPSEPTDTKFAVIGSNSKLVGKAFDVIDELDAVVLDDGTLTKAPGMASPFKFASVADLSSITTPGEYRVVVKGKESEPWVVEAGAAYDFLDALLGFFPMANDGNEPAPDHGPSHLHDATVVGNVAHEGQTRDLTGGWMDAGDQIKGTGAIAFTTWTLLVAARFVDATHATALRSTAGVGVRWLLKAHPDADLFIGQVGDLTADHNTGGFRNPDQDDALAEPLLSHRPAFATVRSDYAGKVAAALAVAADDVMGTEHTTLLTAAQEWYTMGETNLTHANDPACEPSECLYPDDAHVDDLALGASALYRSTGTTGYLDDAIDYLEASDALEGAGPDMYMTYPFAAADLCGGLGKPSTAPPTETAAACADLARDALISVERSNNAFMTDGEFTFGHTARSTGDALIAEAGLLAGESDVANIGVNARDYMLGRNPWGMSWVVDYSNPSTQHAHHYLATLNDGDPDGWLVGGPARAQQIKEQHLKVPKGKFNTNKASYADIQDNYVFNEGSIAGQGTAVLLAAMLI